MLNYLFYIQKSFPLLLGGAHGYVDIDGGGRYHQDVHLDDQTLIALAGSMDFYTQDHWLHSFVIDCNWNLYSAYLVHRTQ
jgi:hypothetical protein